MKRSTGILWLCVFFLLLVPNAFAAEVLTNDAVVTMVKAGLGEDIILDKIKTSQGQFDLSAQGLVRLKESGVSEAVLKAMMQASATPAAPETKSPQAAAQELQNAIALYRQGKVVEAAAAFDKLLAERPGDDDLKVWKALALLEQARAMKDANVSGHKVLVNNAYAILQPLGRRLTKDPDWNFAMGKAFWLNERPTWAGRATKTALELRANFPEAQLLLSDLAYDSEADALASRTGNPQVQTAMLFAGATTRKEYEKVLAMRDVPAPLQAEALYKLGRVAADLEKKPDVARSYWERSVAADPNCRYGVMAQKKLQAAPGR
jgi:tetratricopeptide (TPR) repeat protein